MKKKIKDAFSVVGAGELFAGSFVVIIGIVIAVSLAMGIKGYMAEHAEGPRAAGGSALLPGFAYEYAGQYVRDPETGVVYLYTPSTGGLSPRYNADGSLYVQAEPEWAGGGAE